MGASPVLADGAVVALEVVKQHPTFPGVFAGPGAWLSEGFPCFFLCGSWQHQHQCGMTEQGCVLLSAMGSFAAGPGLAPTALTGDGCIGCQPNSPAPFLIVLK